MTLAVLQQCQKSEIIKDEASQSSYLKKSNTDELKYNIDTNNEISESTDENSGLNPCAPELGPSDECKIKVKKEDVFIPGFDNCPVTARHVFERCDNKFSFFDFIMIIPETEECQTLKDYVDNLTPEQLSDLKDYVEAEGKRKILQWYADNHDWAQIKDVTSYHSLCKETCKWLDLDCLMDRVVGDPKEERKDEGGVYLRGGGPCWKYKTYKCGEGCCVTTSTYVRDADGKLILNSSFTVPNGDCESGPEPSWPHFAGDCPPFSTIVIPCHYSCE